MPSTGKKYRIVLEIDENIAKEKQPYFEFRKLSGREYGQRTTLAESIEESQTGAEAIDKLFEVICFNLVGWGQMIDPSTGEKIPFDKEKLIDLVTFDEARELAGKVTQKELAFKPAKKELGISETQE